MAEETPIKWHYRFKGLIGLIVNNLGNLIIFFGTMMVVGSLIYSLAEEDRSFGDGIWLSLMTAFTVGYGDIFPTTWIGRSVSVAMVLSGLLFTAGVVAWVLNRFLENRDAFTHEEQEELQAQVRAGLVASTELNANVKTVIAKIDKVYDEVDELEEDNDAGAESDAALKAMVADLDERTKLIVSKLDELLAKLSGTADV